MLASLAAAAAEVLPRLEAMGEPKLRALSAKNGAGENTFGANLTKRRKPKKAAALPKTGV